MKLKPLNIKNLLLAVGFALVVVIFLLLFVLATPTFFNASADNSNNGETSTIARSFAVSTGEDFQLNNETVTYTSSLSPWTISVGTDYTNQKEVDAAARRAAEAHNLALSASAVRSMATVASGIALPSGSPAGVPSSPAPLAPGNTYAPGYCTWYAYNRRYQMGNPVGNMWGNGGNWHNSAPRAGFSVDHSPRVGDVIDMPGHVAVVEAVGENNTVFISEMNNGGLYRYNVRWVSNATNYWYIH